MTPQPHLPPSKLHHPTFTRTTLSNGYRAYRLRQPPPKADPSPAAPKPKKTVRFVDGHVTIPDINTSPSREVGSGEGDGEGKSKAGLTAGPKGLGPRPVDGTAAGKGQVTVSVLGEVLTTTGERDERGYHGSGKRNGSGRHGENGGDEMGRYVQRPAFGGGYGERDTVWRKAVRFRGSGRVRVLDDPVRDGREIVGLGEGGWWLRDGKGEGGGDEGEEMTLKSVFSGEGGYTVRVVEVRRGWGKVREVKEVEVREVQDNGIELLEAKVGRAEDVMAESVALTEAGPESESEDEYDCLFDFSAEEAEGWVPVMVAEEYGGDEWMSLTGSWMLMRGPAAKE